MCCLFIILEDSDEDGAGGWVAPASHPFGPVNMRCLFVILEVFDEDSDEDGAEGWITHASDHNFLRFYRQLWPCKYALHFYHTWRF